MKKKMSIILALVIVLTIIPLSSFAETNYDKQLKEAILKSKELFDIGEEYNRFNQNISTSDGETVFYMNWSSSKEALGDVNIAITADGTILNYSKWNPSYSEQGIKIPKFSKEEGLEKAKEFIRKVSPKFSDKIIYIDTGETLNINDNIYRYKFVRIENGVPYYNNDINIALDTLTGGICEYSTRWDKDIKFIENENIISLERAKSLYREKIGLDLIYKSNYSDRKTETFLVYGLLNEDIGINAKNEEVATLYKHYPIYGGEEGLGGVGEESIKDELSPGELEAVADIEGLISTGEAEKVGREILGIGSEYIVDSINLYTDWRNDEDYLWEMSFTKKLNSRDYYASVAINAKTKKLLSFYNDGELNMDEKSKFSKEQSLEIAKEFIKKFNPDDYGNIELRENNIYEDDLEERNIYNYEFIRKIDNSYVQEDGISITVEAVNGKVTQYSLNWSKRDFPLKDNLISLDKAYNILFNDIELELKYTTKKNYDMDVLEGKEAILIYALKDNKPVNIEAKTGTILNYTGKPYKATIVANYKDIKDSYAKDKINTLAIYGISLTGEKFKPKQEIKQKDFLYLLTKAKDPYFDIDESMDNMYKYLIREGIVKSDEKNVESIVTKEEGVKYIIRAMDYSKVADLKEIYKDLFADTEDIDPELKGYMSIAYGLEIIQADDNKLNPKTKLKREDGVNMIYNYLFSEK